MLLIAVSVATMLKLALVALFCSQALARPSIDEVEIDPHIVGGIPAAEGQFPFIVALRELSGRQYCGGALISPHYVLTAAHCVVDKTDLQIGAGSVNLSGQKLFNVSKIIIHPDYEIVKTKHDVALLKLKTPIPIGGNIQLINYPVPEDVTNKTVTALGWGYITQDGPASSKLLYLNRTIIDNKECAKQIFFEIFPTQICLRGEVDKGMCFGDSGSPLLYNGKDGKKYVAGVVSWGIPCAKGYPDVFTRVSSYTQWIKETAI